MFITSVLPAVVLQFLEEQQEHEPYLLEYDAAILILLFVDL